jgi:hypothetical protein
MDGIALGKDPDQLAIASVTSTAQTRWWRMWSVHRYVQ